MHPWECEQRGCSGVSKSVSAHHQQWRELPTYLEGWTNIVVGVVSKRANTGGQHRSCRRQQTKYQAGNVGPTEILASCSHWYRPRPALSELVDQVPSQAPSFVPWMVPKAPCAVQCCAEGKCGLGLLHWDLAHVIGRQNVLWAQWLITCFINGLTPWSKRPLSR